MREREASQPELDEGVVVPVLHGDGPVVTPVVHGDGPNARGGQTSAQEADDGSAAGAANETVSNGTVLGKRVHRTAALTARKALEQMSIELGDDSDGGQPPKKDLQLETKRFWKLSVCMPTFSVRKCDLPKDGKPEALPNANPMSVLAEECGTRLHDREIQPASGRGVKICPHGRQRRRCIPCGGSDMCHHGRRRVYCKDCGGSGICEHNKRREMCRECGGSLRCPHDRQKGACRDCGGGHICPHGRRKNICKECGGASICEHQRDRKRCKECGGSDICKHGKEKRRCRECGGSAYCIPHGKLKFQCKPCREAYRRKRDAELKRRELLRKQFAEQRLAESLAAVAALP